MNTSNYLPTGTNESWIRKQLIHNRYYSGDDSTNQLITIAINNQLTDLPTPGETYTDLQSY